METKRVILQKLFTRPGVTELVVEPQGFLKLTVSARAPGGAAAERLRSARVTIEGPSGILHNDTNVDGIALFGPLRVGTYAIRIAATAATITEAGKTADFYAFNEPEGGIPDVDVQPSRKRNKSVITETAVTLDAAPTSLTVAVTRADDDQPLNGAQVTLQGPVSKGPETVRGGAAHFPDLRRGDYTLTVRCDPTDAVVFEDTVVSIPAERITVGIENERPVALTVRPTALRVPVARSDTNKRFDGAQVTLEGPVTVGPVPVKNGEVLFPNIRKGAYTLRVACRPTDALAFGEVELPIPADAITVGAVNEQPVTLKVVPTTLAVTVACPGDVPLPPGVTVAIQGLVSSDPKPLVDGTATFLALKGGAYLLRLTAEPTERHRFEVPPGQSLSVAVTVGRANTHTVTLKAVPIWKDVHFKLQYRDPETADGLRPFPKDLPVKITYASGEVVPGEHRVEDGGRLQFEALRVQRAFRLAFETKARYVVVEKPGEAAESRYADEAEANRLMQEGHRAFKLPEAWSLTDAAWTTEHPAYQADRHWFDGLDNDAVTFGDAGSPVPLVLDMHWQYVRFVYYDRVLRGDAPVSVLPLVLEGYHQAPGADQPPDTRSNWTTGSDDKTAVQCLPWIVTRQGKPRPDKQVELRFSTDEDHRYIETKPESGARAFAKRDAADALKPGVERMRYYDLPALWRSTHYAARQEAAASDAPTVFGFFQDVADTPTTKDRPLVVSLDDLVLTDKTLAPLAWTAGDRVALFRHDFRGEGKSAWPDGRTAPPASPKKGPQPPSERRYFSEVGLYNPDDYVIPAIAEQQQVESRQQAFVSEVAMPVNYVADYPHWTRLVVAKGNLFDVFGHRVPWDPADPAQAGRSAGARAAVCWIDATAPFPGIETWRKDKATRRTRVADGIPQPERRLFKAGTSEDLRPARVDAAFAAVQPFYEMRYANRYRKPYDDARDEGAGRFDMALLRCCDVRDGKEVAVNLHYFRYYFDFIENNSQALDDEEKSQFEPLKLTYANGVDPERPMERPEFINRMLTNVDARWNGLDGTVAGRAQLLPQADQPPAEAPAIVEVVWFSQALPAARAHYRIRIINLGEKSRDNRNGVWGRGNSKPTSYQAEKKGRYSAAHEAGHMDGLPDEYNERWKGASYGLMSFKSNLPGDPYEPDGMGVIQSTVGSGMMNGNYVPRNRYFWQSAEWVRRLVHDVFAQEAPYKVSLGKHEDYHIPVHETPGRTYAFWPFAYRAYTSPTTRARCDFYLYTYGKDYFSEETLEQADGVLVVVFKIYCRLPKLSLDGTRGKTCRWDDWVRLEDRPEMTLIRKDDVILVDRKPNKVVAKDDAARTVTLENPVSTGPVKNWRVIAGEGRAAASDGTPTVKLLGDRPDMDRFRIDATFRIQNKEYQVVDLDPEALTVTLDADVSAGQDLKWYVQIGKGDEALADGSNSVQLIPKGVPYMLPDDEIVLDGTYYTIDKLYTHQGLLTLKEDDALPVDTPMWWVAISASGSHGAARAADEAGKTRVDLSPDGPDMDAVQAGWMMEIGDTRYEILQVDPDAQTVVLWGDIPEADDLAWEVFPATGEGAVKRADGVVSLFGDANVHLIRKGDRIKVDKKWYGVTSDADASGRVLVDKNVPAGRNLSWVSYYSRFAAAADGSKTVRLFPVEQLDRVRPGMTVIVNQASYQVEKVNPSEDTVTVDKNVPEKPVQRWYVFGEEGFAATATDPKTLSLDGRAADAPDLSRVRPGQWVALPGRTDGWQKHPTYFKIKEVNRDASRIRVSPAPNKGTFGAQKWRIFARGWGAKTDGSATVNLAGHAPDLSLVRPSGQQLWISGRKDGTKGGSLFDVKGVDAAARTVTVDPAPGDGSGQDWEVISELGRTDAWADGTPTVDLSGERPDLTWVEQGHMLVLVNTQGGEPDFFPISAVHADQWALEVDRPTGLAERLVWMVLMQGAGLDTDGSGTVHLGGLLPDLGAAVPGHILLIVGDEEESEHEITAVDPEQGTLEINPPPQAGSDQEWMLMVAGGKRAKGYGTTRVTLYEPPQHLGDVAVGELLHLGGRKDGISGTPWFRITRVDPEALTVDVKPAPGEGGADFWRITAARGQFAETDGTGTVNLYGNAPDMDGIHVGQLIRLSGRRDGRRAGESSKRDCFEVTAADLEAQTVTVDPAPGARAKPHYWELEAEAAEEIERTKILYAMAAGIQRMYNNKEEHQFVVEGTINGHAFSRCLVRFVPQFLVGNYTDREMAATLRKNLGEHFTARALAVMDEPNPRWDAEAPDRAFTLEYRRASREADVERGFVRLFPAMLGLDKAPADLTAADLTALVHEAFPGAVVKKC